MECSKEIIYHILLNKEEARALKYIIGHPDLFKVAGQQEFYPEFREKLKTQLGIVE